MVAFARSIRYHCDMAESSSSTPRCDYLLVGTGIMSATLGALLKVREPDATIRLFEAADTLSPESSDAWNNAGTGHAGICELSYTPFRNPDGSVDVSKAISIFAEFERSRQFWATAVQRGMLGKPSTFLTPVPHISFVVGEKQVDFLRSRFEGLTKHHFFAGMEYSEDRDTIAEWAPLLVEGRRDEPVAATRMTNGTDMNFGAIARQLCSWLWKQEGCEVHAGQKVVDLVRIDSGWRVEIIDRKSGEKSVCEAGFVFIGAGGGSLRLLQKSGIPEAAGYGGFPVGGQWMVCTKPEIVSRHTAKVYGQPQGEAPTMAVPHLDTRVIDGKTSLLFGPFASWTTKFLKKTGSWTDLPATLRADNLGSMIKVGLKELPLVGYLVKEGLQSMRSRTKLLREFYPQAKEEDWRLQDAGIRVQAIKKEDGETGIVHFGTEVLTDSDKTIAALLGASPGASVSVHVMLELIRECFGDPTESDALAKMIPALRTDLVKDAASFKLQSAKADVELGM